MANVNKSQRPQGQSNLQTDRDRSQTETGKSVSTGESCGSCDTSSIEERMSVVASCGTRVGVVDHLEGNSIKLTRKDSKDGQHHFIPVGWVEKVDGEVHLKKNSEEAEQEWKSSAAEC